MKKMFRGVWEVAPGFCITAILSITSLVVLLGCFPVLDPLSRLRAFLIWLVFMILAVSLGSIYDLGRM